MKNELTPRLSGCKILNEATLIIRNWLLSRLIAIIIHNLYFIEEHKW